MKTLSVSVSPALAKWLRVYAAQHEKSVSRMVASLLEEKMLAESSYQQAQEQFLSRKPAGLRRSSAKYPKRDELYD